MKILFAFNLFYYDSHELNCAYYFFVDTCLKMGHQVQIVDFGTLNRTSGQRSISSLVMSYVTNYKPDLLFTVPSGRELSKSLLFIIKNFTNTVTLAWNSDDDRRWENYSSTYVDLYDLMITTYENIFDKARKEGHNNVLLSQWASNPDYNKPIKGLSKKYDVAFVGVAYGDRPNYIQHLINKGFNVKVAGKNWDKYISDSDSTLSQQDMSLIYNQSKIALVFSGGYEKGKQIKGRVFETPAYKVCTFIEDTPGLEKFYIDKKEVVSFTDKNDLVEKLKLYLEDDELREKVAQNG